MRQRLTYLINTYLWTVLIFVLAKIGFMLANQGGHAFSSGDVWDVIRHGLTLDLSTALYFLILPFLMTIVSLFWQNPKWLQRIQKGYFALIALAFALAFVADTSLYPFWGFKLDSSCLQYLESPDEMAASVSTTYLLWRLVIILFLAFVIYKGYVRNITMGTAPVARKWGELVVYILCIPLMVIGIRGGLDESTTNVGQVYYSQNQFLNHSAVNPVFSFLDSFTETVGTIVEYKFYDETECEALLQDCYPTESILSDTLLTTQRPNVIIIIMESASEVFAKAMPRLNSLKREGITFSHCYGNTYRTDRGTVSTLSGYPSFPTMSVMKMAKKAENLPSIAQTLQQEGYKTSYLYGGDINFTDMRGYLIATGWEKLHWKADYSLEEQNSAKWGVRDDITFQTLYDQVCAADTTKRFLMGYSTLSSHEPWDVPVKKYDDEHMNAFWYLDQCIGDFTSRLKATPYWKDMLIILLPDHGINYQDIDETSQERNHIPMIWIGGAVKESRVISQYCNQTDLAATLLGQLGLPHETFTFSRDVLSQNYMRQFAMHCYNNGFSIVDSTGFTVYDLTSQKTIIGQNADAVRLGKAILQTTSKDLKEMK